MEKEKLTLQVKDKKGEVIKVVEANTFDIYFGTIDSLMQLLDINEDTSSFDLLKKISTAWGEVTSLLGEIFPDMTDEDWKFVRINDLVPIVLQVVKYTFLEIMTIPSDSKN
jgi:hypothetical protein